MMNGPRKRPRVGVSACLLGLEVRWDGEHKREPWLVEVLGPRVEWVPVCPEVEVGLGVPREPIRLVGNPRAPRLMSESGTDLTGQMRSWVERRAGELASMDLAGYVLKKGSPSCGMERVRVHRARGGPSRRAGVGLFARGLRDRFPLLPIEEEAGLRGPLVRAGFVERIFSYARWKNALVAEMTPPDLARFHAEHELAVLAHGAAAWRRLETLLSPARRGTFQRMLDAYGRCFMEALETPPSRRGHADVLRRIVDRLEAALSPREHDELGSLVRDYQRGRVPLLAPLRLARDQARRLGVESLASQVYLNENPEELLL
jgi:uncharacterized protein YbbK (DUF523 family)/uncharacterized protein YbgA (DUF1722 family)